MVRKNGLAVSQLLLLGQKDYINVYMVPRFLFLFSTGLIIAAQLSCSITKTTANMVAGSLARESNSEVFSGDDDPQLIGEALPFTIKLYESLIATSPNNPKLLLATGRALCMYSYAYVQMPAEQLSYNELTEKEEMLDRAKHLYLRARYDILKAIWLKHRAFFIAFDKGDFATAFKGITAKDTSYLYWAGAAWMAALTTDKSDVSLAMDIPKAVALVRKVLDFNDSYGEGSAQEFFVSYFGGMPAAMGGSDELARKHFDLAVKYSNGLKLSPYIALATTVSVKNQNIGEFKSLLQTALKIDVNRNKANRLVNILNEQKARWLLDHVDNFFLSSEGDTAK
jgi:predicted anti-sigma-YlaC factor YlaD